MHVCVHVCACVCVHVYAYVCAHVCAVCAACVCHVPNRDETLHTTTVSLDEIRCPFTLYLVKFFQRTIMFDCFNEESNIRKFHNKKKKPSPKNRKPQIINMSRQTCLF